MQAGRDALRLPGQLHGADAVAADTGEQAEDRQGHRLGNRVITAPGQGQGAAGIVGRLGDSAHAEQRRRPAAQAPGQQRERPAVPYGVAGRGEVAQRPGRIGRIQRRLTEPGVTGAPRVAARGGAVDGRAQQRHLTREPATDLPPPRQRDRQPRCHGGIMTDGRIVLQGPVQHPAHGGVLGIQPPSSSHLAGAGRRPRHGVLGHPQRVPGQRGGNGVALSGLGQQPRPVSPQRLQHHIPGPAIRADSRRDQQRAVHKMQHSRLASAPATASAPSSVNGPGNTDTARNTRRSRSFSSR